MFGASLPMATVREWIDWASDALPASLRCSQSLPERVLDCPIDRDVMEYRVKCFAASAVLHQAFADKLQMDCAVPSSMFETYKEVRKVEKTWFPKDLHYALEQLHRATNDARHDFFSRRPGSFFRILSDWMPLQSHEYGFGDMLDVQQGCVVEESYHEDDGEEGWRYVRVYSNFPNCKPMYSIVDAKSPKEGWVPQDWLGPLSLVCSTVLS